MIALSYFPVVDDQEQLIDLLSRAAWFLSFCPIDRIYIPIASGELQLVPWRVAPGMDESISDKFAVLREKVVFVVAKKESDLDPCMTQANIILRWKKDFMPDLVSAKSVAAWEKGKKVWQVDPVAVRMEGSYYIEVGLHLLKDREVLIQENKNKFDHMARKLGKFKQAYLLATGPSVSRYKLFDYTDALSIVCNSVILDEELMGIVRPQILVFADPIFHFGPSQYAAAFRAKLREAVKAHEFMICIPFKYYAIFTEAMPELKDRTVAIPFVKDRPFNFNLSESFEVRTTANILTLLMTPIAASFADRIGYLGCDGRPLIENNHFWSHNQSTQINDKMANIRATHPGFFAIDYNDYYLEHCGTLEAQFQAGEKEGKRFYSLGFSHIPALKRRIDVGCRKERGDKAPMVPRVLLIDPDAKNWSGHYMAYNEKLRFELGRLGADVQVACRKDLSPDILSTRPTYSPVFTEHSWAVGNRADNAVFIQRFEEEMAEVIQQDFVTGSPQGEVLLYMYCGNLEHAKVLANLQKQYPFLRINVNLFWLSFRINHDWIQPWKPFVEWLESQGDAFMATVPTRALQSELAELTGCILPVAPHPSTAITDETYRGLEVRGGHLAEKKEYQVLFPSAPRPEKGYVLSIECARLLGGDSGLRSVIRHAPTSSTPKPLKTLEGMPANTTVIAGELPDEEFIHLFATSDIVVLPYMPEAFAKRTSGLLIDTLYHRIPCVVIEGTWLAEVVRRYDCGVIVEEASAPSIAQAVRSIAERYDYYRANAHAGAVDYFYSNSWEQLGKCLLGFTNAEQLLIGETSRPITPFIGPYGVDYAAHWDETNCVAKLFETTLSGSVMIDVGAHHGSSLVPFLNMGWKVWAFEPDDQNRQKLVERLAKHGNSTLVKLDPRAVSNESNKGLSFYRSDVSTGISGLSAFHPSHKAEQIVDTVTLTEALAGEKLEAADFLKIDTEGHDLFVLKGFPWQRFRPAVIECEFEDAKTVPLGYTFHDLAKYLVEKGYTIYVSEWHPIIRYGIRHDWHRLVRYPCELANAKAWGNLLAFRDPIDEAALIAAVRTVLKFGGKPANEKRPPTMVTAERTSLVKPPKYHRMFDYNRALLPNRQLAKLEEGVTGIEQARIRSGATVGYPGWGMLYHLLLCHLDRERTEVIVETGTNLGCTTIILAQALIDAGCAGHVVTFEFDEDNAAKARENLASAGLAERVELHVGDSYVLLPKVLEKEHFLRVVCLDASHLYEETLFELENLLPKLADDAIVLVDNADRMAEEDEDPRVTGALKTIQERHGGTLTNFGSMSVFTPGPAIWQRQLVV